MRKAPPPTYWEEYVATDAWYVNELLSDIPENELHAALVDENWGQEECSEEEETDAGPDAAEQDQSYSETSSDGTDSEDGGSDDDISDDASDGTSDECSTEETSPRKRQRRGEGADAARPTGAD
jgi:hypothetical protein